MTPEQSVAGVILSTGAAGSIVSTGLLTDDVLHQLAIFFACMTGGMMSLAYIKSLSLVRKVLVGIGSGSMSFNTYELVYAFFPRFEGYDQPTGAILGFLMFNLLGGVFVASSKFSKSPLAFIDWVFRKGDRPGKEDEK